MNKMSRQYQNMELWDRLVKNRKASKEILSNSNPYSYTKHWARLLLHPTLDLQLTKTISVINFYI